MKLAILTVAFFALPAWSSVLTLDPSHIECSAEAEFVLKVDGTPMFEAEVDVLQKLSACSAGLLSAKINGGNVIVDTDAGTVVAEAGSVVTVAPELIFCELTIERGFVLHIDQTVGLIIPDLQRVPTYFACTNSVDAALSSEEGPKSVVIDLALPAFTVP